jgi:hypothetical protein
VIVVLGADGSIIKAPSPRVAFSRPDGSRGISVMQPSGQAVSLDKIYQVDHKNGDEFVPPWVDDVRRKEVRTDIQQEEDSIAGTPLADIIGGRAKYTLSSGEEVTGDVYLDGQTVVIETPDRVYEVGNVNDLASLGGDIPLTGIAPSITISDDGSFVYSGTDADIAQGVIIPHGPGLKAIKRDKDGNIKRIVITDANGNTKNLRGQEAEDLSYYMMLRLVESNQSALTSNDSIKEEIESEFGGKTKVPTAPNSDANTQEGLSAGDGRGQANQVALASRGKDGQAEVPPPTPAGEGLAPGATRGPEGGGVTGTAPEVSEVPTPKEESQEGDGGGVVVPPPAEKEAGGADEERVVKKTIAAKRAYEGEFRKEVKDKIESLGLTRVIGDQEKARDKARSLVGEIGPEAALDAVRNGDVRGAEATFVYGEAINALDDAIANETDPKRLEELYLEEATLIQEISDTATLTGQANAALDVLYKDYDLGFKSGVLAAEWQKETGEKPSDEQIERWRKNDKEIDSLRKRIAELEKKAEAAAAQGAVDSIKESVVREQMRKRKADEDKKTAKRLADRIRGLKIQTNGSAGAFIVPPQLFNAAIEVIATSVQAGETIAAAIAKGVKKLQESQWYKDLSKSDKSKVEEELSRQINGVTEAEVVSGRIKVPKQAIRDAVAGGATTIDALVSVIREQIKEFYPDATDREIRDAITDYGKVVNMSKDELSVEVRRLRNIGRLTSALEDVRAKKRPLRSGLQRDKLDAEQRLLQKQLRDAMKDLPIDAETQERELRTALDAAKSRYRNRIEELEVEIQTKQRNKRNIKTIEADEELKELQQEKERLQAIHDEIFKDRSMTIEERLDRAMDTVRRSIESYEDRISNKKLDPKKPVPVDSPELNVLRQQRDRLREEYKRLQDEAGITQRKRLDAVKKATENRIRDYERRILERDFSKKERRELIADKELTELRAARLRIKEEFDKELYRHKLANRTKLEKAKDFAWQAWGLTRALQATGELSFVLMQGGALTLSNLWHNPTAVKNAFKTMWSAMRSERKSEEWLRDIRSQEWYPVAKEAKLAITEPHSEATAREELFFSDWTRFIWNAIGLPFKAISPEAYSKWAAANPFRAVERGAVGYLDTLRIERFLDGMAMLEKKKAAGEGVTKQDYKDVADVANTLTGRASLGKAELMTKALTKLFFSPRLWASSIKTATPYALWHFGKMTPTARKMAIQDMGRMVGTTMAFVAPLAFYLNNDDDDETSVETDPRSSDFGKIKIGDTRIDPWGGRIQQVVLSARIIAGTMGIVANSPVGAYKNKKGRVLPLGAPGAPTMTDLGLQMLTNKLSPTAALAISAASTKMKRRGDEWVRVDRFGKEYELSEEFLDRLYPIYIGTVADLMDEDPGALEGFLMVYSFFGGGVQEYESKKKTNKEKKEIKEP